VNIEAVAKASEEALAATARANEAEERAKLTEDRGGGAWGRLGWIFRGVPMDFLEEMGIFLEKNGNLRAD